MFIILPLLAWFFLVLITYNPDKGWRVAALDAAIGWGVLVAAITEFLSLLRLINFISVLLSWLLIDVVLSFLLFRLTSKKSFNIKPKFSEKHFYTILLTCVVFISLIVGLIALVAPPNNWDSMDYHMPRVVHWIQNHSVEHYPTSYTPQLFSPPWSGFAILHFQILSGGDRFANLVQWFSMVGSLIGVSLITKQLGADLQGQVFSVVLCVTIPVGILHATNTKDTYVVAFWLVCFVYYVLVAAKERTSWSQILKLGTGWGLAIFSKGTAYIYGFPFFLWFILIDFKRKRLKVLNHVLVIVTIIILINHAHYIRNFNLFGSPTSTYPDKWSNEAYGIPLLISNILKNVSLHLALPLDFIDNGVIEKGIYKLHNALGLNINDPRITAGTDFSLLQIVPNFEDTAGNPIHFWLLVVALVICLSRRNLRTNKYIVTYFITVFCSFLLFCLLLKWQIWHSRLHLPLFVLFSPFVGIIYSKLAKRKLVNLMMMIIIELSLFYVLFNEFRPLIGESNIFNTSRIEQYLRPVISEKEHYINTANFVKQKSCKNIGLSLPTMEYPWWILLKNQSSQQIRIEHINVDNVSNIKSSLYPFSYFNPCAIILVGNGLNQELTFKENIYFKAWQSVNALHSFQVFIKR